MLTFMTNRIQNRCFEPKKKKDSEEPTETEIVLDDLRKIWSIGSRVRESRQELSLQEAGIESEIGIGKYLENRCGSGRDKIELKS